MTARAALDWPALLRVGLLGLRLTPDQFWCLTPAELRLMLNLDAGAGPMDRAGLSRLMAAFPDQPATQPPAAPPDLMKPE